MKICYIAPADSIHTHRWVKYFADRGHEVHLISFEPLGDGDIGRTELHILKRFSLRVKIVSFVIDLVPCVIQVRKLLKKINPDILHAHYITDNGLLGVMSGFHPLVLSAWGSDILIDPKRYPLLKLLTEYTLKKADVITCTSRYLHDAILQYAPQNPTMKTIPFGIDIGVFKSSDEHRNHLGRVIGTTKGHLRSIYGLEYFIKSIPHILEKYKDVKVLIAGSGDHSQYSRMLKNIGIENAVQFVGLIPHGAMPEYLSSMDDFLSRYII